METSIEYIFNIDDIQYVELDELFLAQQVGFKMNGRMIDDERCERL
jgi:hypothetical protein